MRQTLVALTLTAALLAGRPTLFDQLWTFLGSLWTESAADAGCGVDPDGWCNPEAPSASDVGPGVDPDGQTAADVGPGVDPNG